MKKSLMFLCLALMGTATSQAAFIAGWTFETSIPTTSGPLSPEVGAGTATASTGGTFSNPAGFGSNESWSSTAWDVGDYYQFQVSTIGFTGLTVTWDQTGSNTGPANFSLSYSLDGTSFTDFGSYTVTNDGWNATLTPAASVKTFNLGAITVLDEQPAVYFRLTDTSTVSISGATVASTGTGRIDNFEVTATAVPEPSTYAMVGLGLGGLIVLRRLKLKPQA